MKREPVTHGGVFEDEAFAGEYARKHRKMAEGFGRKYAKKLRNAGFTAGRILDAGCGSGATNLTLAQRFPESELVGIDLSDPLLGLARQEAEALELSNRVRFRRADVQDIPFGDNAFDVVLCLNMVHLVQDPDRMLAEVERVLAPDGFLFLADLRRSFLGILEREIRSALSAREARRLLDNPEVRSGTFSSGLLWWRFESLPSGR